MQHLKICLLSNLSQVYSHILEYRLCENERANQEKEWHEMLERDNSMRSCRSIAI